jgi:hypothetical protein
MRQMGRHGETLRKLSHQNQYRVLNNERTGPDAREIKSVDDICVL